MNRRGLFKAVGATMALAAFPISVEGAVWDGTMPAAFRQMMADGWRVQSQWIEQYKAYLLQFDRYNEDRTQNWAWSYLSERDPFKAPNSLARFWTDDARFAYERR